MVEKILDGNVNKLLGLDKDYAKKRQEICESCPIFSERHGGICNSNLWINPETDDISFVAREGYIRGCDCVLRFKWNDPVGKCVAGKW